MALAFLPKKNRVETFIAIQAIIFPCRGFYMFFQNSRNKILWSWWWWWYHFLFVIWHHRSTTRVKIKPSKWYFKEQCHARASYHITKSKWYDLKSSSISLHVSSYLKLLWVVQPHDNLNVCHKLDILIFVHKHKYILTF